MPDIKCEHQTLGIVQLPDKGIKLVGLTWSTVFLYFQNTKFRASIEAAMATWYICSWVSFSITIVVFFFFRTLPDFKTSVAEATCPFKGKRLAVPICAKARALLWRLTCYGKGGGVREAKKIAGEAGGEEGTVPRRGCGGATHTFAWGRWDRLWVGGSRLSTGELMCHITSLGILKVVSEKKIK